MLDGKADTYDDGKPPLAWLPWAAITAIAKVQAYGHKKYKDFNNYRRGLEVSRNLSCALRHIKDHLEGVDIDPESGEPHLAHALCRIAFVLQNIHDGTAIDDRYRLNKPKPIPMGGQHTVLDHYNAPRQHIGPELILRLQSEDADQIGDLADGYPYKPGPRGQIHESDDGQ